MVLPFVLKLVDLEMTCKLSSFSKWWIHFAAEQGQILLSRLYCWTSLYSSWVSFPLVYLFKLWLKILVSGEPNKLISTISYKTTMFMWWLWPIPLRKWNWMFHFPFLQHYDGIILHLERSPTHKDADENHSVCLPRCFFNSILSVPPRHVHPMILLNFIYRKKKHFPHYTLCIVSLMDIKEDYSRFTAPGILCFLPPYWLRDKITL